MNYLYRLVGAGGSGQSFPYDLDPNAIPIGGKSLWKLHSGSKKADRSTVSVFLFDSKTNGTKVSVAQNAFKRSRTIRHPNLLPYLDGIEVEAGINIVTEEVRPLSTVLEEIKGFPKSISWGLHQVAKALSFLNNDCKMVHGNVVLESVFVNKSGDWKLGGFDLLSGATDLAHLRNNADLVPAIYKAPEYQNNKFDGVAESPWAVDTWMLACLIYEIYNGKMKDVSDLKNLGNIPKALVPQYKAMIPSSASARLNPAKFLESEYFNNEYVETCMFLENIAIKDSFEKDKFFQKLDKMLDDFPKECCKHKILPHLIAAIDFGGANSKVLGPLLKIGKYLTPEEYTAQVIPSVVKWFASTDRSLRVNLLQNLESFIEHLSNTVVSDHIFPNVASGFTDTTPALRELTVKSMLLLVPKLNEKVINTQLLKHFAKLQMDEEPGIRSNTTICLAKIASYLTKQTRSKILVPAFCRALKDPFPKARVAGLMAFNATQAYYSSEDIAVRILPVVLPLAIDTDKEVRDITFKTVDSFVVKLKNFSETGIEEQISEQTAKADSTVLGWALGSLSKKIYGDSQGTNQITPNTQSPSSSNPSTPVMKDKRQELEEYHAELFKSKPQQDDDDEDDGWDNNFDDFSEPQPEVYKPKAGYEVKGNTSAKSTLNLNSRPTAPSRFEPEPEVKSTSDEEPSGWDNADDGWDNEDDGWDDFEVKAPKQSKIDAKPPKQSKIDAAKQKTHKRN